MLSNQKQISNPMKQKFNFNYLLIAISIMVSVFILGAAYKYKFKSSETIVVTGLAEQDFTSDFIVWTGSFSRTGSDLKVAYTNLKDKREIGVEIHSGRNRIVRRIFEHLKYEVKTLDRVMYAGLTKKNIPRGKFRALEPQEVVFLKHFK